MAWRSASVRGTKPLRSAMADRPSKASCSCSKADRLESKGDRATRGSGSRLSLGVRGTRRGNPPLLSGVPWRVDAGDGVTAVVVDGGCLGCSAAALRSR